MTEHQKLTPLAGVSALFASFLAANLLSFVAATILPEGDARTYVMYFLPQLCNIVAVFAVLKAINLNPFYTLPLKEPFRAVPAVLSPLLALASIALSMALLYGFGFLSFKIGITGSVNIPKWNNPLNIFLGVVFLALLPAVGEELMFRGLLLKSFQSMGGKTAVLLAALIFAVQHMNVAQLVHQFILGVVLGYLTLKTKNIWYAVLVHFVNNVLAQGLDLWQGLNDFLSVYRWETFGILCGVTAIGAAAVAAILILIKKSKGGGYLLSKREVLQKYDLLAVSATIGVYIVLWVVTAVAI